MLNTLYMTAGQRVEFYEQADFFRVLEATGALDVTFYSAGKEIAEAEGISKGYAERFDLGNFDRVAIVSAVNQTIKIVMRQGAQVFYDAPPTGDVTITNTGGAFAQSTKTVTSTAAELVAANAARRYLLIQNNGAGDVVLNFAATATLTNGIKIAPGGSYEMPSFCHSGSISAIGSIASNAAVIVVEG